MAGYNPRFLTNFEIPLPTFTAEYEGFVLQNANLRSQIIVDYPHYSIVMNKDKNRRSLFFSAFNIDQNKYIQTPRSNDWRLDSRLKPSDQLGDEYYKSNPWDRGHSVRNATASYGDNPREASLNARETFYYTNSTLQHENLNQDEWLALEDWVKDLELDLDGKITEFSGPFYGEFSRSVQPGGREIALTPSGYFKIICFVSKQQKLETRAFIIYQDEKALKDKKGKLVYNNQNYQVTVTEIEALTGLIFPALLASTNPLFFNPPKVAHMQSLATPERHEIGSSLDIISNEPRPIELDDRIDLFIASAMIKPKPGQPAWISIINFDSHEWDLNGWAFGTAQNSRITIQPFDGFSTLLLPGQSVLIEFPNTHTPPSTSSGALYLWDNLGRRIDRVNYTRLMTQRNTPGKPMHFLTPRDVLTEV